MKKNRNSTLFFIISLLLHLFISSSYASPPGWFDRSGPAGNEVIGYGEGKSLQEATANAKNSIAKTIYTHLYSEETFRMRLEDGNTDQEAETFLKTETDVVLTDLALVRKEKKDGIWYVALKYENLPAHKKFIKKLNLDNCSDEQQNRYLAGTPLVRMLNKEAGCLLDYTIVRTNGMWYISHNNTMQLLSKPDFEKLFIGLRSRHLMMRASETLLIEGDSFNFSITPEYSGYITMLNVYENGETFIIFSNRRVNAGHEITFPPTDDENELVAGLLDKDKPTFDLYISIISRDRIDISRIQQVSGSVEKQEEHFKFQEVLDWMDRYDFSTVLTRTKPGAPD